MTAERLPRRTAFSPTAQAAEKAAGSSLTVATTSVSITVSISRTRGVPTTPIPNLDRSQIIADQQKLLLCCQAVPRLTQSALRFVRRRINAGCSDRKERGATLALTNSPTALLVRCRTAVYTLNFLPFPTGLTFSRLRRS